MNNLAPEKNDADIYDIKKQESSQDTRAALIETSEEAKTNNKGQEFGEFILTKDELKQHLVDLNSALRDSPDATNYTSIVKLIVYLSQDYLVEHRENKSGLRFEFVSFFKQILGSQLIFLFILIFFSACNIEFKISDSVLIAYMTSIFVETLGCIILMIKFAFKSDEEVQILAVLNKIVENFQK